MKTDNMDLSNQDTVKMIVDGCIRGDRDSQHLLYKATYGKMLGTCMRYAANTDEAKDFLHDGYIKVFEKIKYFKHTGSFEGWIRRIIVNNTIDSLRKKNKMQYNAGGEFTILNITDDTTKDTDKLNKINLSAARLIELIQDLTPAYRTVFNLYVIEEYSHKEIAEMLNVSIGTSKSNLAKAKMKLKKLYTTKYGEIDE
ncbi:MAG: RNA polymerase sigma factor [Bacteroidales bacterium]|nr:RNA polymerase sigma factor [Bacteroidales bacterium]